MSQERTEGVVLRAVDFSETSRIVTFLTPDRGRLACMAAGARRPKSAMAGLLDTFNRVEVVYYWRDSRSVQRMGDVTLLDGFGAIKADLEKTMFAAFPLEIAYKVAHEDEPSESLYKTLVAGLKGLAAWPGAPKAHTAWHVLRLVSAAGFEPSVRPCVRCGKPIGDAAGFSYDGGAICGSCPADRRLSRVEYRALEALAGAEDACPEVEGAGEVFDLLCGYVRHQFETDFRSLRVIRDVCGS